MRVLVAEDEMLLAEALGRGLRRAGMTVDVVHDGAAAIERMDENHFDAIVLDRDLPICHGDVVCEHIVTHHPTTGVLMLTAADRLDARVEGLNLGADDYVVKPFEFPELIARLRSLRRRTGRRLPRQLHFADVHLDPSTHLAHRGGKTLALTPKEFRVLEELLIAAGSILSAEALLERAWDAASDPFTNSPRVVVSTLRKKLGRPWPIETIPRVGYRMIDPTDSAGRRR